MLRGLGSDVQAGLTGREAADRLAVHGANLLRRVARRSRLGILAAQFRDVVVALLAVAAVVSFAFGQIAEGVAIVVVLLLNATIGFVTELRAARSVESLRTLGRVTTTVRRDGAPRRVPAEELVVGDVALVEGGDVVTADLRVVEASRLEADESALTGESVPVGKSVTPLPADTPLADRTNMLFKGTAITQGSGVAVVVATGMDTELGRISSLVQEAQGEATPLQVRLDRLGRRLVWVTAIVAVLVVAAGLAGGQELSLTLRTAIALAVAAIPEGLPVVATLALARGVLRMARHQALVERLSAVETLGSTNVILTDKTGTLTENRMTVQTIELPTGPVAASTWRRPDEAHRPGLLRALRVGALCNDATLGGPPAEDGGPGAAHGPTGDPMEVALLEAADAAGLTRTALTEEYPRTRIEAFDPAKKMMATVHRHDEAFLVAVKGAPEAVLNACSQVTTETGVAGLDHAARERWHLRVDRLAAEGMRMLALAERTADRADEDPYQALTLIGLVGLLDPPRRGVDAAVRACREAGIRVVMVTGDHLRTGEAIAHRIDLIRPGDTVVTGSDLRPAGEFGPDGRDRLHRAAVVARASPEQKIDLLALHQEAGDVVAMIGDGVNDAPALSRADIGVAMGRRGTDVAREAADMILRDDRFATIVTAVEQGRTIFDNIRRFVVYLITCNLSEILVVGIAALAGGPLPLSPIQILFLNLVTDVFPALALGLGSSSSDVLRRPPRPTAEPVLTGAHWRGITGYAAIISGATLAALALALNPLDMPGPQAVTVSFLTLGFAQLWYVLNTADVTSGTLVNEVSRNRWIWAAFALCTVLLLAGVYLPVLSDVLSAVDPGPRGWAVIVVMSLVPLAVGRAMHRLRRRGAPGGPGAGRRSEPASARPGGR
ncbi:cation-translocating P-type ATPase [Micromonospora sp. MS34]|uniref:cation-translocating P-type ATPase n=1 Tax=Micromonospora sp. MS34 TaxID=3385971 RepID=UPI0039A3E3E6